MVFFISITVISLQAACLAGKHKVVRELLAAGANWRIGEKDGYTCMHGAAFQGEQVKLFSSDPILGGWLTTSKHANA